MSSSSFVKSLLVNQTPQRDIKRVNYYTFEGETWQESVARILLTGILKNTFYLKADAMAKEALPLFMDAAKKDPKFLMKAACMARDSNMKGMVKVALAAINGQANERFLKSKTTKQLAIALLNTFHPGQLLQFVELCKTKSFGRGFGARPQKWVRATMESWNANKLETYTLKYPTALHQLVRLVHPRYTDERAGIIVYILDGRKHEAKGKRQVVVERLKAIKNQPKTIANAIIDHNVPWDVIKGFAGLEYPISLAAMTQMGLSALLSNIRSLQDHGAFNSVEGLRALKLKMNEVKNSRSIAIDFAKPYIYSVNPEVKNILVGAMADTLDVPMPQIENKKIGLSIDISGSMAGENLIQAGLMAIPFLKAKKLWFTTFDQCLYEEGDSNFQSSNYNRYSSTRYLQHKTLCPVLHGKTRQQQIHSLLNLETYGGTNTAASVEKAIKERLKLDVHVIITDEHQNTGRPLFRVWKEYRAKVNSNAELWIIDISNDKKSNIDFKDPSVTVYHALTPAIFNNLKYSGMNVVEAINTFDIDKFINTN